MSWISFAGSGAAAGAFLALAGCFPPGQGNVTPAALFHSDSKEDYAILPFYPKIVSIGEYKTKIADLPVTCPANTLERRRTSAQPRRNVFEVSTKNRALLQVHQSSDKDCWAASVMAELAFLGFPAKRSQISPQEGTFGNVLDINQNLLQLVPKSAIRPSKAAIDSGAAVGITKSNSDFIYRDDGDLVDDLLEDVATIVVLNDPIAQTAHSYMLGTVEYSEGNTRKTIYRQVELFDPKPLNRGGGWTWVSGDDLKDRMSFVVRAKELKTLSSPPARCKLQPRPPEENAEN